MEEVVQYINEFANLCYRVDGVADDMRKREATWIAKENILDHLSGREYALIPVGMKLKTVCVEIVGETAKAWKLKVVTSKVNSPGLVDWIPKSQSRKVGDGFLLIRTWLIRNSFLKDALSIPFVGFL
jgi:hypothetical protein